ncbi:MAG TPA: glycosyl hydrolase [Dehalococcoidia bacterium]|nr:glycosyl hydrolase [Dehalococcoidia bacterium]
MGVWTKLAAGGLAVLFSLAVVRPAAPGARAATRQAAPTDLIGVLANGDPSALPRLGATWFLTDGAGVGEVAGMTRASIIRLNPPQPVDEVMAAVASRPGGAWLVGNEPNVPTTNSSDALSPSDYAVALHDWEARIHTADPTAIIVGPNVLNWSQTCNGCPGYTLGLDWTTEFYNDYVNMYGVRPPIDKWAVHTYELDWVNLPTLSTDWHKQQLRDFRAWLDAIPDEAGRPIWDTEVGFHWAFPGDELVGNKLVPTGPYDTAGVQAWMSDMLSFFTNEGVQLGVERSFFYAQWGALEGFSDSYGGLAFFDGPQIDASLTPSGQQLQAFFQGAGQ